MGHITFHNFCLKLEFYWSICNSHPYNLIGCVGCSGLRLLRCLEELLIRAEWPHRQGTCCLEPRHMLLARRLLMLVCPFAICCINYSSVQGLGSSLDHQGQTSDRSLSAHSQPSSCKSSVEPKKCDGPGIRNTELVRTWPAVAAATTVPIIHTFHGWSPPKKLKVLSTVKVRKAAYFIAHKCARP